MSTTSRRERIRRATLEEIRTTARRLLVEKGPEAVTINAIARIMGMSGPALYRYYTGHNDLVEALTVDFYRELIQEMRTARDAEIAGNRRLLAVCRAMRAWAVANPAEFRWVFASPIPSSGDRAPSFRASEEFGRVFLDQIVQVWQERRFPAPELDELDPSVREQLEEYSTRIGGSLPPAATHVFLTSWIRLYGLLSMEVLGQLDFAFPDVEPVFEELLRELCRMFAVDYEPA